MSEANAFELLNSINVNEHTEVKNNGRVNLTYLSWAWAWAELKKRFPNASYSIIKNDHGLPYFYDPACGIMVYTTMTIEGVTHEMWLPVMDGANNAMRFEPYEVETSKGKKLVKAATMMDINKTVMRCLTKNIGMFGLGLYIYAGEDIPEDEREQQKQDIAPLPFTDDYYECEECGAMIADTTTKSGKIVSASQIAKKTMEKYNMILCTNCAKGRAEQ